MINRFSGRYRFLSNFCPSPFDFRGAVAPTVEHAFQACKTESTVAFEKILAADTPTDAKRLGRAVYLRRDWDFVKLGIMRELLALKFANRSRLAELLVATADHALVEGNTWGDTFWGVCGGRGENWLGHLLMARRAELRDQSPGPA